MPGLIGRKLGMTQVFDEDGRSVGVTVIEAGPCPITQVKTLEHDGYDAVQVGFGRVKDRKTKRPEAGHASKAGLDYVPAVLHEFAPSGDAVEVGSEVTVAFFEAGHKVRITGVTRGRGFQGVVKRHGFAGGRGSHGGTSVLRKPGSIGAGTDPSRVIKGLKMAGQMGGTKRTAMSRRIVQLDADHNLMLVEGSVPGAAGGMVFIRPDR